MRQSVRSSGGGKLQARESKESMACTSREAEILAAFSGSRRVKFFNGVSPTISHVMAMLCEDVVAHIAAFADHPVDVLNVLEAFGTLHRQNIAAVCSVLPRLAWQYSAPPLVWEFNISNVIEIPSLEPQYNYRSFLLTPSTRKSVTLPIVRTLNGREVLHVHESWIVERIAEKNH